MFPRRVSTNAFTLLELLVVIGIIAVLLIALVPAIGPSTGRALETSTRQFTADLQSARLIAMAERTRTRVLIPLSQSAGSSLPSDVALRAYMTTVFDRTTSLWKQRGKWQRLAKSVAFDPAKTTSSSKDNYVLNTRATEKTPIDANGDGTQDSDFTGPYIEFLANGAARLDPGTGNDVVGVADAIADASGNFTAKNKSLRTTVSIDPLSGGVIAK